MKEKKNYTMKYINKYTYAESEWAHKKMRWTEIDRGKKWKERHLFNIFINLVYIFHAITFVSAFTQFRLLACLLLPSLLDSQSLLIWCYALLTVGMRIYMSHIAACFTVQKMGKYWIHEKGKRDREYKNQME